MADYKIKICKEVLKHFFPHTKFYKETKSYCMDDSYLWLKNTDSLGALSG